MEGIPLNWAYLNSLTTGDLIKMADSLGVDIPHDPDRVSIIEELLEIASLDKPDGSPGADTQDSVLTESVPLPKQYNISFIEVMIRDPLWAFAFWEIKAHDKEQFEKAPDFNGYCLKVSPWVPPGEKTIDLGQEATAKDGIFSVSVSPNDTAWYLGLNPAAAEELSLREQIQYKVELCACLGESETVLAVSNPVRLPGLPEMPSCTGKQENGGVQEACVGVNELVRLSGYGDFHIIRRNERSPRAKRGESTKNE